MSDEHLKKATKWYDDTDVDAEEALDLVGAIEERGVSGDFAAEESDDGGLVVRRKSGNDDDDPLILPDRQTEKAFVDWVKKQPDGYFDPSQD